MFFDDAHAIATLALRHQSIWTFFWSTQKDQGSVAVICHVSPCWGLGITSGAGNKKEQLRLFSRPVTTIIVFPAPLPTCIFTGSPLILFVILLQLRFCYSIVNTFNYFVFFVTFLEWPLTDHHYRPCSSYLVCQCCVCFRFQPHWTGQATQDMGETAYLGQSGQFRPMRNSAYIVHDYRPERLSFSALYRQEPCNED